jgi:metal-responsive CopG/Arc/MetJ family transcriptional regulator
MKTAISIPDDIFSAAEQLAKRVGYSRSELYTSAIAAYLKEHRGRGVTERLNEVYAEEEEASLLDPVHQALQAYSLAQDEW